MVERALVHIGTHKTGTTAFQTWAQANKEELAVRTGMHYYEGRFGANHYEFPLLCLRSNRNMPMRPRDIDWCLDAWKDDVRDHIRRQVRQPVLDLLICAESLSLLRHRDEVETLADLLKPRTISVAVVLREPASFLESYREELESQRRPLSRYRESYAYVEDDSWLIRYDELIDVYRSVLGVANVCVVRYEESLERYGSTVPAVLEAFGADCTQLPAWDGVWLNATARSRRPASLIRRVGRPIVRRLRRRGD